MQTENDEKAHPELADIKLGQVFHYATHIPCKAFVLELEGHVNIDRRNEVKPSLVIFQFFFELRESFS